MIIGVDSGKGKDCDARQFKCENCGNKAKYRIWTGYLGYEYYCEKCKEEQTMGDGK